MAKDEKLVVQLLLKFKSFTKGLGTAQKHVAKFSGGVNQVFAKAAKVVGAFTGAVVGAGTALVALVNKVAAAGDAIAKMGRRTGLSTEYLSEMEYVLGLNDATLADLQTGFRGLAIFIEGLGRGTKEYTDLNDQLGVSLRDEHGRMKTSQELMDAYMNALRRIRDPILQAGLAQRIFGRSAIKLLPAINAARSGIAAARGEARRMGVTLSGPAAADAERFRDAVLRLRTSVWGLLKTLAEPFVKLFAGGLDDASARVSKLLPRVRALGKQAALWVKVYGPYILTWIKEFGAGVQAGVMPYLQRIWSAVGPLLSALGVTVDAFRARVARVQPTLAQIRAEIMGGASSMAEAVERARAKLVNAALAERANDVGTAVGQLVGVLVSLKAALWAVGVVLAVAALLTKLGGIVMWVAGAVKFLIVGLAALVGWPAVIVAAVVVAVATLVTLAVRFRTEIWAAVLWLWNGIVGAARAVWGTVAGVWTGAVTAVGGWLDSLWGLVVGWVQMLVGLFVVAPARLAAWLAGLIANVVTWVASGLASVGRAVLAWIAALPGVIWGAVQAFVAWLGNAIYSILPGWAKKLLSLVGAAWEKIKGAVGFETKGSPSMRDVMRKTFERTAGMVERYGSLIRRRVHASSLGMARGFGQMVPAVATAGRAADAAAPGGSSTANVSLNLMGILDEMFVRRQLSPQIQRAVHLGLAEPRGR